MAVELGTRKWRPNINLCSSGTCFQPPRVSYGPKIRPAQRHDEIPHLKTQLLLFRRFARSSVPIPQQMKFCTACGTKSGGTSAQTVVSLGGETIRGPPARTAR